ncbi:MAG TPA: MFS transporter [Kofleriaceae bacterium]|jgi:MFS family permease
MPSRFTAIRLVLRGRNYRLFVAGQLVSLVGTWTRSIAQAWLVYRLAGSALWLGIVAACQQVPVVIFASLGGSLADRYRRRTTLVVTQIAAMALSFTLAGLVMSGTIRLSHMIVVAVLAGVVSAADIPTRQSFVADMVGRDHLMTAVALNSSMAMCAASLGPMIAGFAVDAVGEGWCFFADGVSFAAVIAALLAMRELPSPNATRSAESFAARIAVGFQFARRNAQVRALLALLAITAFAGLPYGTLFPALAAQVFHGDARALGVLTAASGAGALLGAAMLALRRGGAPTLRLIGLACAVLGATLVAFACSHQLWLSLVLLVPLGAATMTQVSATNTLIQIATPDALRGRVMAIWAMIVMGFVPLGALVASAVASFASPGFPLAIGGVICVLAAVRFRPSCERTAAGPQGTDPATRRAAPETPR